MWGATDVSEFKRKHTGNIRDSLDDIRRLIEAQKAKRDAHRDTFASLIRKSMQQGLGDDADEVTKTLRKHNFGKEEVARAVKQLGEAGKPVSLRNLVDALTQRNVTLTLRGTGRTPIRKWPSCWLWHLTTTFIDPPCAGRLGLF